MNVTTTYNARRETAAFSLIETLVAVALVGVVLVSLYTGISNGFAFAKVTRENLRATQILQEKMETIRLYTWEQLSTPGFVPTNFLEGFYASGTNNGGLTYTGKVIIATAPIAETYGTNMKQVSIQLSWKSGKIVRNRQMDTFTAKHGLQNYIY
ncbi:MAG TPA: prepilin-type N-terminal cleavage/methylation domain-containing protein [Verrucomicrobiae bacterium]|nr:prepilin-type N-terminal cleavage/methylation domain-containing protein [Verrucomicrobiae bacterium]